jgi:uncharacterized protein (DUF488 family)
MNRTVYTIGHSTHSIGEFVKMLQAYGIETVADVRKISQSRHNPQFGEEELRAHLGGHGIAYRRLEGLGGLRRSAKASVNAAWKNLSFRGYADYMQTPEFKESLEQLIEIAAERQTAIMCAEAVPWRCHRSLIGDALLIRNIPVIDIMTEKTSRPHALTSFAKVDGDTITYPGTTV